MVDAGKQLINEVISEKLDMEKLGIGPNCTTITVADLGCSIGPNTFYAIQIIIEAIKLKHITKSSESLNLEFQVYFNDNISNDFNMLFRSLPPSREYYVVGVPNSFYERLFPKSSIHLMYSSASLHWLSGVPKEVKDPNSLAWNEERIYCATEEVTKAYSCQFEKDMKSFLRTRAEELVSGGLMMLFTVVRQKDTAHSQTSSGKFYDILGSCLIKMANRGLISKEKVNSFNLPIYNASTEELKELIDEVNYFTIERMEEYSLGSIKMARDTQVVISHIRAAFEGLIRNHFGDEVIEELFEDYTKAYAENLNTFQESSTKHNSTFAIILKRI
ncbi:probable S-adenosylmethionine-dependent methyltransferase At5g38780 [Carica papaya]|uniref:probable S-adenosylmethionine-dependent methyltransferase At5g38780 n=1 Tax=Carica papaya TaxID=3649 RepID=UPI000B8CEDCC|nr:probable S-adenosylmethionine-dependent methyltransferase At5g38780 [Carica papaya]